MTKTAFLILLVLLVSCSSTKENSGSYTINNPLNSEEMKTVKSEGSIGKLIYEKDIRAAVASDMVLSQIDPTDYQNFVGWVTYPHKNDFRVTFYENNDTSFTVMADVDFENGEFEHMDINPDRVPIREEVSMIKARIKALRNIKIKCSDRFNTVVVPGNSAEHWDVYVLAATIENHKILVGGHNKITISKDDNELIEVKALSNSCLTLDLNPKQFKDGEKVLEYLFVTHNVTQYPIAIHSFLSLLHDKKFLVATTRGTFFVYGDLIMLVDDEMNLNSEKE